MIIIPHNFYLNQLPISKFCLVIMVFIYRPQNSFIIFIGFVADNFVSTKGKNAMEICIFRFFNKSKRTEK